MLVRRLLRIFSTIILAILVIILVAVVGLFVYEPSPAEGFAFSSAGKTIQLSDGRTLAYLDSGDPEGHPVFYFHGSPGSRLEGLMYDELNQQLGIRMIVLDRPGYGLSDFQEDRTYSRHRGWRGPICKRRFSPKRADWGYLRRFRGQ
jgi:hypothetical protein